VKLFQRPLVPSESDAEAVRGERGLPSIHQAASLQSRISNALAMGLVLIMGVALLAGYYLHTEQRRAQARQKVQAASSTRASSEMLLPALGHVAPAPDLTVKEVGLTSVAAGTPDSPRGPPPPLPTTVVLTAAAGQSDGAVAPTTSADRRLAGAAFERSALVPETDSGRPVRADSSAASLIGGATPVAVSPIPTDKPELATFLHATSASAVAARLLPTQRLWLPKGAFIDCTLETAIDSSLPGMTTCITATDTFGVDGKVVLLERGTKLVGETRGQVQQGNARLFVLWTQARTPAGVIVPLDSPGADELGRAGLSGTVERHFWQRFGAALLITTIDAGTQAAVQSSNRGTGTVLYNPSATQDVTTEVLKSTLSIAPTVRKDNGDRIQVLVARDIDFTSVYELRHASGEP
jgi:type IV secretion system protein VirB10